MSTVLAQKVKETREMTDTVVVKNSVFDLEVFGNVELGKEVVLPDKPESLEQVTHLFSNDKQALLDIIWDGMCAQAKEKAQDDKDGWHQFSEDGNLEPEVYNGKYADAEKKKQIDAMVLNLAKAVGLWTPEKWGKEESAKKKEEARQAARKTLFENKALLDMFKS
jgi:hypothetical protein